LAYELSTKLLKEQLGSKGLVVTDATTMAGMVIPMTREQGVPQTTAASCDMFFPSRSIDEDYAYMKKGIEDGVVVSESLLARSNFCCGGVIVFSHYDPVQVERITSIVRKF